MSNLAALEEDGDGEHKLNILHGARPGRSFDPDTSRIWWEDVGVHQNLTHAVHPDPISGAHCWLQKAVNVRKAAPDEKSRRCLGGHGPLDGGLRRVEGDDPLGASITARTAPAGRYWLKRPLKPVQEAYKLPDSPFGRS